MPQVSKKGRKVEAQAPVQCVGGLPSAHWPSLQQTDCMAARAVVAVDAQRDMVGSWLTDVQSWLIGPNCS